MKGWLWVKIGANWILESVYKALPSVFVYEQLIWNSTYLNPCSSPNLSLRKTDLSNVNFLSDHLWIYLTLHSSIVTQGLFCKPFLGFLNTSVVETSQYLVLYSSKFLNLVYFFNILSHWDTCMFSGTCIKLGVKEAKLPFSYTSVLPF